MSNAICTNCGSHVTVRTTFELEGECPECGLEALVAEDAYDETPSRLRCTECGWEVDAVPPGMDLGDEAGRYSVDDNCPVCEEAELAPLDSARGPRQQPEAALARAAARKLLQRYAGEVPVQPEGLAEDAGLRIERGSFDHDGMLVDAVIEVPAGDRGSERWVIAHELGHHLLRHQVPEPKLEEEANAFAAELLLPREQLRAAVRDGLGVRAIARRFGVNRQPVIYALQRTRLINQVSGP